MEFKYLYRALDDPNQETMIEGILIPSGGLKTRTRIPVLDKLADEEIFVEREELMRGHNMTELPSSGQPPSGSPPVSYSHVHIQTPASAIWIVNHNLGFYPKVTLLTDGGEEFDAEVIHINTNQARIYLAAPRVGTVRLS